MINKTDLIQKISEVAKPIWDALLKELPELVTEDCDFTFEDFCTEIRMSFDMTETLS